MSLLVLISLMLVIIGTMYFYGTAYPYGVIIPTLVDVLRLVGGAAYQAAGLSFGLVLAPLFILRCLRFTSTHRAKV